MRVYPTVVSCGNRPPIKIGILGLKCNTNSAGILEMTIRTYLPQGIPTYLRSPKKCIQKRRRSNVVEKFREFSMTVWVGWKGMI